MGNQDNGIGDCSNTVIFCILRFLSPSKVGYSQWRIVYGFPNRDENITLPISFTNVQYVIVSSHNAAARDDSIYVFTSAPKTNNTFFISCGFTTSAWAMCIVVGF